MVQFILPLALVVVSNVVYQVSAKSVSPNIDPFASLTVTYVIGATLSLLLYFVLNKGNTNLLGEYSKINWASFVLGFCVVGLEVGYIYAFKAGWEVSKAQIVQATAVAIILLIVGMILFKEAMTWNKIVGMAVCLAGLVLINLK